MPMALNGLTAPTLRFDELTLEPLRVEHAAEMAVVLDDTRLHSFVVGAPADESQLRRSYEHQVRGCSEDGQQVWLNWVVRDIATDEALGYVQATVTVPDEDGDDAVAHLAWVVGIEHQGQRVASRAVMAMGDWLCAQGVATHVADIHPDHTASQSGATVGHALHRRAGQWRGALVDGQPAACLGAKGYEQASRFR